MNTDVHEAKKSVEALINAGGAHNIKYKKAMRAAPDLSLYGPFFSAMVNHAAELVEQGIVEDPRITARALAITAELYTRANRSYDRKPWPKKVLEKHQYNVLHGNPSPVDEQYRTTAAEGIRQVRAANALLTGEEDGVESEISRYNYGGCFFGKGTMADASRTLLRGDTDKLIENDEHTAMPHLSISNYVIGQTIASVMKFAQGREDVKVRIFDYGSGHGATLSAIFSSINRFGAVVDPSRVAFSAIETTKPFFDKLQNFVRNKRRGAPSIGLKVSKARNGSNDFSRFGFLTTVFGDAPAAFKRLIKEGMGGKHEIIVLDGNYVNHRLPDNKKTEILGSVRECENVVIAFGDLIRNTSIINRGFFNRGANGPVNCGNEQLREILEAEGFEIIDLNVETPELLEESLADRMVRDDIDPDKDGHIWIAARGALARESLGLMPVDHDFSPGRELVIA